MIQGGKEIGKTTLMCQQVNESKAFIPPSTHPVHLMVSMHITPPTDSFH